VTAPPRRIPVAVLGATGAVGQTFIRLLEGHPWFELHEVAASERSAGRRYGDAAHWLEGPVPDRIADLVVTRCDPAVVTAPIVFSALDSAAAGPVELAFAEAGRTVCSNARNHRMLPDVPLLIPEVNAPHLRVLEHQRRRTGWAGGIVTNANCAATVATVALAPLHETFGVRELFVATMQAVSGAGYPGVPSLDILGNVIPYIGDEEPKVEAEIPKLLGEPSADGATVVPASIAVSAHTNRVPVEHGHTVCLSVRLITPCTPDNAMRVISEWRGCREALDLPSRPPHPVAIATGPARPQPRRDVSAGRGMTVTVGRIRSDPILDLRLVAMGSNTIRGAAGGAILNAELLVAQRLAAGV